MSDSEDRARSRSPVKRERSRSRSPRRNRNDRNDRPSRPFQGGRRVVVRNIPYEIKWQELKDLFRKEIGDVSYVELLETPDGKSKGVAVVEFKDSSHAKTAIEDYHQYKIKDRAITIREEREKDRQEFLQSQRDRGMDPRMGGGHGGGGGAGPGINPQTLMNLGIDGPITNTVFVANLDYKVTWWKLKDVFRLAGNVVKAEIKEDRDTGKSRGMGIVQFEQPFEAVQAVSMFNGQTLYDRNMIVRVDKGPEPDRPKLPSGLKSIGMGLGSGGVPISNLSQLDAGYPQPDPYRPPVSDLSASALMGGLGGLLGGVGGVGSTGGAGDYPISALGSLAGSGSAAGLGMNLPLELAGLTGATSKLDALSALSGLGGVGPNLTGLTSGLTADRLNLDNDRLGTLMDRMATERMRDSYGLGGSGGLDRRDGGGSGGGGGRRTTRPDNCTVMVKNLPYSVNWQELKEHFRDVGDVKFAEIVMEKGKSTGVGYVRFATESDAQRAIASKHRSRMERRNIDVLMHRS